jgi:hypothetical protein
MSNLETEKIFRILKDHSVGIIESHDEANELSASLELNQQMKVNIVYEENFPPNLVQFIESTQIESVVLHIPVVTTTQLAETYKANVVMAYQQQPRMIILEGLPVNLETMDLYNDLRDVGIPMIKKGDFPKIIGKLAQLFTQL